MRALITSVCVALFGFQSNAYWAQHYELSCTVDGEQITRSYDCPFNPSNPHPADGYVFVSDTIGSHTFEIVCMHTFEHMWSIGYGFDGKYFSTYESQIMWTSQTDVGDAFWNIHKINVRNFKLHASNCHTYSLSNATTGTLTYDNTTIGASHEAILYQMCNGSQYNTDKVTLRSGVFPCSLHKQSDGSLIGGDGDYFLHESAYVSETRTPKIEDMLVLINDIRGDGGSVLFGREGYPLYANIELIKKSIMLNTWWDFSQETWGPSPKAYINGNCVCEMHSTGHIISYNISPEGLIRHGDSVVAYARFSMRLEPDPIYGIAGDCDMKVWDGEQSATEGGYAGTPTEHKAHYSAGSGTAYFEVRVNLVSGEWSVYHK